MHYLVRVGGELFVPIAECSRGFEHYSYEYAESAETEVNPKRPALPYLRKLLQMAVNAEDYGPTERVNLLYGKGSDALDLSITELARESVFDFFVGANGEQKRLRYVHGQIFVGHQRLDKQVRVRDLFGNVLNLELTHIGSPGVEFIHRDDYDAVYDWVDKVNAKHKAELQQELGRYLSGARSIADESTIAAHILLSVAQTDELPDKDEIVDMVKEGWDECQCYFDDHNGDEEVRDTVWQLVDRGFLEESEGRYRIAADYRKRKGRKLTKTPDM